MSTERPDRRITAARPDLAAEGLRGRVEAPRFVAGERRSVIAPLAPVRRAPRPDAPLDTEALHGEAVTVYDTDEEGWCWIQLAGDDYVGYMPAAALGPSGQATHRVRVLRTFVFPGPDLKLPPLSALPLGAQLRTDRTADGYAVAEDGFVWSGHLGPIDAAEPDFVAVAERFLEVPYLWGGKSALGIDCSGLVQLALFAAGLQAPRDSDMQERQLGAAVDIEGERRRGDLVFWAGHVGIMRDERSLLHANAHAMAVSSELLVDARARIRGATGRDIRTVRRFSSSG